MAKLQSTHTHGGHEPHERRGPIVGTLRRLTLWGAGRSPDHRNTRGDASGSNPAGRLGGRGEVHADRHHARFLESFLRPGDCVLDVGANTGAFSMFAARLVGSAGRVDALEPSPTMRAKLIDNVAQNQLKSVVVVHNLMAGASQGLGRFVDGTTRSGRRRAPLPDELATRVIGVECVRLDRFMGRRRYALMRLDIAGSEFLALRGAEGKLAESNPPAILVALDASLADFGATPEVVADWVDEHGYELALYDADRNTIDYPPDPWRVRRYVLAMARMSRNFILQRLAGRGEASWS
jgi:FkbM family methyltransferase